MKNQLRLLILATAVLAGSAAAGARDELKAFTGGLKGLQGQFTQQVYDSKGVRKENSSGQVALSLPSLFRWEYTKPHPQLIVADGSKVWIYDPDLKQVTARPQGDEAQNSPLAALIDSSKLDQKFKVSESGSADGLQWLTLVPRNEGEAGFQSARLGFGNAGLARMEVLDALGQRTSFTFTGWKRNPAFPSGTFKYVRPKGVDLVGEG